MGYLCLSAHPGCNAEIYIGTFGDYVYEHAWDVNRTSRLLGLKKIDKK